MRWDGVTPLDRFLNKVVALDDEDGGCWIWLAAVSIHGYGQFGLRNGMPTPAHRWSYQHFVGPIPDGLVIDHVCRRRDCVNPDHLEAVTQGENLRRGRRDRMIYASVWGERGELFDKEREMRLYELARARGEAS